MATTLTQERFEVRKCWTPAMWISEMKQYIIESGPTNTTFASYTPSNYNNSQLSFSLSTPSPDLVLDRHAYIAYRIQMYDSNPNTGAAGGADGLVQAPFNPQLEGLRQLPLHSGGSSISCAINGTSFSWTPDKVISAMLHYYKLLKAQTDTNCTIAPDCRAEYGSTIQNAFVTPVPEVAYNPFTRAGTSYQPFNGTSRNIFNCNGTYAQPTQGANQTPFSFEIAQVEPVILPPFEFGVHSQVPGLFGVSTLTITYNFDYNRFWCGGVMDASDPAIVAPATAAKFIPRVMVPGVRGASPSSSLFSVAPILLLKYYTLPPQFQRPSRVSYPFYDVNVYQSTQPKPITGFADYNNLGLGGNVTQVNGGGIGANTQLQSPTILANSIPHRTYLFTKRALSGTAGLRRITAAADVNSQSSYAFNSTAYPEVFGVITRINATINNQTGILSSANALQLYNISVANGLEDITFQQFMYGSYFGDNTTLWNSGGLAISNAPVPAITPIAQTGYARIGPGSVVCLAASDLSLSSEFVSGSLGKFSMQFNVEAQSPLTWTDNWDLYTVLVNEGITTYDSQIGTWSKEVGIVSSTEVLNAPIGNPNTLSDNTNVFGGSIFSKIGSFAKKMVRDYAPFVRKAGETIMRDVMPAVEHYANSGSGRIRARSRPRVGGARMSRRDLL